jgi:hypothetical protein
MSMGTGQEQLALEEPLVRALPSHELLVRSALHQTAEALALLRPVEARAPGQPGVSDAIKRLEAGATPAP